MSGFEWPIRRNLKYGMTWLIPAMAILFISKFEAGSVVRCVFRQNSFGAILAFG